MKTKFFQTLSACAAGLTLCASASAQTSATTDPVGYAQISCLANSDTRISIPFTRPAEFTGTISSVTTSADKLTATITVAATPNWTTNQFAYVQTTQPKTYYAIIGPNVAAMTGTVAVTNGSNAITGTNTAFLSQIAAGDAILINGAQATVAAVTSDTALTLASNFIGTTASGASAQSDRSKREGAYYTVTANGSNTLTVALNGDSLSSLASSIGNTSVTVIPYWTLGTAFPAGDAGASFTASTNTKNRATQILLPNLTGAGTDLTAAQFFFFYQGNWRQAGQDYSVSYDDTILYPTTFLTLRNTNTATTFTPVGSVYMNRFAFALNTLPNDAQDNSVGVPRPANVTLNDLGLIASGGFTPGTSTKNRGDLLFTYPIGQVGYDLTADNFYFYLNGMWQRAGDTGVDYGNTVIPYGAGLTIRKAATSNGATAFWQNGRNY